MKEKKIPKNKFKTNIKTLLELEKIFGKYEQKGENHKYMKDTGYLIDKKDFDNFKNKLFYPIFKTLINDDSKFNAKLNKLYENNKEITFTPCEQKSFNESKDLIDNLFKYNEYVIINLLVWKMINNGKYNENEGRINYEIKDDKIILSFGTGKQVYFQYNSNIITRDNLISQTGTKTKVPDQIQTHMKNKSDSPILLISQNINKEKSNEKMIEKLYLSMIVYNNFEKSIMNKLNSNIINKNEIFEGYFLEKNWFRKWKEYTDYDNNRFLLSGIGEENKNKIKSKIKQFSHSELYPINIITYINKTNFDKVLLNDIFILVNEQFLSFFEINMEYQKNYKIKFNIENHQFIFLFDIREKNFKYSFKNILPIEKDLCFQIANNLIELYIFQEKLKLRITKGKKDENENLILVDSKYLSYIKSKYSFNKICDSIKDKSIIKDNIKELNNINKNKKYILGDIISGFNWEFFSDIYNAKIDDINENYELEINEMNIDNKKIIIYFDNFELIDKNIFDKLNIKEEIKNKISKPIQEYYIDNNTILIKYENLNKKDNIHMIGYIQNNNIFISEYYIESTDPLALKYYFSKNKINGILQGNNCDISNGIKIIGKLHKIKEKNIEAIYDLFLFNKEIKQHLNDDSKKVFEAKLYLINEKWFSEFKKIYLYENIYQNILSKTNTFSFYNKNIIIKSINDNFLNKIINSHVNNNHKYPLLLKDSENLKFYYQIETKTQEAILSNQYSFINEDILGKMMSPEFKKNEICICDYYINNKKFIIKYDKKYIIIGEINFINESNLFFPEIILDYDDELKRNEQFKLLKMPTDDIKSLLKLKGEKVENMNEINSNGILGKAYFLKNTNLEQTSNLYSINIDNNDNYIKILFNIYMNYKYIDYKISKKLQQVQFEICYIVNKNYINKLKDIFKYKEFYQHKIKEKFDKYKQGTNNFDELLNNKTFFEEVKKEASQIQFNINDKQIFNKIKNDDNLTCINKEYLKNNNELYYYNNFEIISNNLYQVLDKEHLILNEEKMIKTNCLFGENKIIFYPSESNVNYLIISDHEFVSDYIFFYDNSSYLTTHIKEIQKNGYENAFSKLNFTNNIAKIFKESLSTLLGRAYKIKEEKPDSNLSQEIKDEISIIIKIYLFNLDLKKYVNYSMNHAGYTNYGKYIHKGKCYLINKDWMSEYKKHYLYDELYNYLEKEEIKKKLDIHHFNKSCYNESEQNVKLIYEEIKNNAEFFKKYFDLVPKKLDEKLLNVKEVNSGIKDIKNKEIKYYDEFVLINSELKKDIIVNKYKKNIYENEYIINQGKIIICLNYYPVYQILIGSLNDENDFLPLAFIIFIGGAELEYSFSELKNIEYNTFIMELNKDNNKIFDKNRTREVGALYYVDDIKKIINENNAPGGAIPDKEEKDCIKYMIELYYSFDSLNFHIKDEKKTIQSQENYYLINKEWINYLNKYYNYEKILKEISKNKNNRELIKKYRENIEINLDSKDINDIINQIPAELKNNEKKYDINFPKLIEKKIKENTDIYYYDECILINEAINNILVNITKENNEIGKDVKCFISSHNIYICYTLKENYLISIAKLAENNILKVNILVVLDEINDYNNILFEITKKGQIPTYINQLKQEKKKEKILYDSTNKKIGFAILLNNLNKENNFSEKIERSKKIEDEKKSQIQKEKALEAMKKLVKEEMKSLLKFHLFNKKLIEHLDPSKCDKNGIFYDNSSKYYLINNKFMDKFRNKYSFEEFIKFLNFKFNNNIPNNIDSAINQVYDEVAKTEICKNFFGNFNSEKNFEENILDIDLEAVNNGSNNLMYLKDFEIIDDNFYNKFIINKSKPNYQKKILLADIIINNGKLIILLLSNDKDSVYNTITLIGNIQAINNNINYKFNLDILINFFDAANKQQISLAFRNNNYINVLKNENLMKNIFIHYFDESLKQKISNPRQNNNYNKYPYLNSNNNNNVIPNNNFNNNNIITNNGNNIATNNNANNNLNNNFSNNVNNIFNINNTNNNANNDANNDANNNSNNLINYGKNIIELFIILYLHYEKMKENIKKDIKCNFNEKYCIINKEFMRKYKEYYNYQGIINILLNEQNVQTEFIKQKNNIDYCLKNKVRYEQFILPIIQKFKNENILELGKKRENQDILISYLYNDKHVKILGFQTYSKKTLSYYEDAEIIDMEIIKVFNKIESEQIKNLINKLDINCLIGENKIFIKLLDKANCYYYLDIGQLKNNIFATDLIIYYYENNKLNDFLDKIKNDSFKKFISSHIKDVQEKNISKILNTLTGQTEGKIIKIKDLSNYYDYDLNNNQAVNEIKEIKANELNDNAKKILKLILYNNQFINRIQNSIKEGEINRGYLVKFNFMVDISKSNMYKFIFNYICNNPNIQQLLGNGLNVDYKNLYQNVKKEFNVEAIKNINKYNNEINIYSNTNDANINILKLNTGIITYYTNEFIILNDEIYKFFSLSSLSCSNEAFEYFYKEKKIFIKLDKSQSKNSLLMCYMNNQRELILESIFYFFNPINREYCIKQIIKEGYNKCQKKFLLSEIDLFSPIFDISENYVGNAYKYNPSINDFSKYNINFEIRKIFLLHLNYIKLKNPNSINKNLFKNYYLVNKAWIKKYKDYYNFDKISGEINKNNFIQNNIYNLVYNSQNTNINLKDKLIAQFMKQLPQKIIDDFNNKESNFSFSFKNEEMQSPIMSQINYNNNILFYFYDFELISSEIYEFLFKYMKIDIHIQENKSIVINNDNNFATKAEKAECIFDEEYIIIQFPNPNSNKKYLIEIGKLDNNNIFEPEYLLLYDQYNYLNEHVQNILSSGGFKEYCKTFSELPLNTLDIISNNNLRIGIAIKKNMNPEFNQFQFNMNNNMNNNIINNVPNQNNQQFMNDQLEKFKNANTIIIKGEGNKNDNNIVNPPPQVATKLHELFPWPPKVGLDNIGSTCYMNATLQCFCQIEEFALYFKYDKHINEAIDKCTEERKDSLTASFKILVEKIWPDEAMRNESNKRHFAPNEFRKKIADMSPLFENIGANDAKDLVNFIIMTLHEELNESLVGNNNIIPQNNFMCNNQLEYLFQLFYQDYQRNFRSKISELFYAIQQTQTRCLSCKADQFNFQAYFFLVFPLEEVRKHAINKTQLFLAMSNAMMNNNFNQMQNNNNFVMGFNPQFNNQNNMFINFNNFNNCFFNNNNFNNNMINNFQNMQNMQNMQFNNMNMNNNMNQLMVKLASLNNNIVTIMDCFDYNQKVDYFEGSNQIYCGACGKMANANYCTYLTTAPKVLIILLNRGTGIQFKVKLEFTEILDITNFVNLKQGNSVKYQLIGVITHLGESGQSGHFIAHCKSPIDNEWYTYNDAIVSKIENFQQKVINMGMPYLLFYKRIE